MVGKQITESLPLRTGRGIEESGRREPKNLNATYRSSPLVSKKPVANPPKG